MQSADLVDTNIVISILSNINIKVINKAMELLGNYII